MLVANKQLLRRNWQKNLISLKLNLSIIGQSKSVKDTNNFIRDDHIAATKDENLANERNF